MRSEHGYDRQLSPKLLSSPTSKEFYCMVEFLYRQIDPNYVMDKKFEEAIPSIFKSLGYPFPISKTALYAVGSPHTWPVRHLVFVVVVVVVELAERLRRRCSAR